MGRRSVGAVLLLGLASVTLATYPTFSFLSSETRSYPPYRTSYGAQSSSISAYTETSPDTRPPHRPVTRTQRGIAYIEEPTIIYAKSPLLYPEATVFSDPLPIVPLPQLPAEFLTLKSVQIGSDDKDSKKKNRKGKGKKKEEDDAEADDAQETEGDVDGGYPSSNSRQRQPTRLRERQNKNRGGNRASGGYQSSVGENRSRDGGSNGVSGGYPGSQESDRIRSAGGNNAASGGYSSSFEGNSEPSRGNNEVSGGYQGSFEANRAQFRGSEGASGGYPGSSDSNRIQFAGNSEINGGYSGSSDSNRARFGGNDGVTGGYSGSGSSSASRAQSGGNNGVSGGYPSSFNANDNTANSGSRRGQGQQSRRNRNRNNQNNANNEFMRTGDEADDSNNAAEVEDDDDNEEVTKGRGKNQPRKTARRLSGRNRGGSRLREENADSEEDEVATLSRALSENAQKLGTFYVPTFGNNVLNTIYPAFSQNALLRSLDAQKDEGYPESGKDVSAISISADDDDEESVSEEKKPRKSKSRSSRRKNRPGRRGENRLRTNDVRAQEPRQDYGVPEERRNQRPGSDEEIPPLGLLPSRRGLRNRSRTRDRDLPEDDEVLDDEVCDECDEPRDNLSYGPPAQTGNSYGPPAQTGYTQPQSSYGAPTTSGYQPALTAPAVTGYSQAQQSYGAPTPALSGYSQPIRSEPQSSYGAPPQQSQPAYGVPQKSQALVSYEVPSNTGYSQPQSSYGAPTTQELPVQPLQSYGAPSTTSAKFVEPRQLSQTTSFDNSGSSGGVVDQELIKTVQAILAKYPN